MVRFQCQCQKREETLGKSADADSSVQLDDPSVLFSFILITLLSRANGVHKTLEEFQGFSFLLFWFLQDWKMYLHDPAKLSVLIPSSQYDASDLGPVRYIKSMFSGVFRQNMKDLLVIAADFTNVNVRTQA